MFKKICSLILSFVAVSSFLAAVEYEIQDIGTLQTYSSEAIAINNQGQILGWYNMDPKTEKQFFVRDRNANFQLIPNSGIGMSISWRFLTDSGKAYGTLDGKNYSVDLFIWDKQNGIAKLGSLPGHKAHLIGVNNEGQVLISCILEDKDGKSLCYPIIWHNGQITKLPGLKNELGIESEQSYGLYINNSGDVVGHSKVAIVYKNKIDKLVNHAVLWSDGQAYDLHKKLPEKGQRYPISSSIAFHVNDSGKISIDSSEMGCLLLDENNEVIDNWFNKTYKVNNAYAYTNIEVFDTKWNLITNLSAINYKIANDLETNFIRASRIIGVNDYGEIIADGETIYGERHAIFLTPNPNFN